MDRRTFLAKAACGSLGLGMLGAADLRSAHAAARGTYAGALHAAGARPNIILIMADDMGFSDVGCYGGEIHTPNLDRLAGDGLRFSQFYNCARCCPTRASLLTGLYPHQAGIGHMTSENEWTLERNKKIAQAEYQGYLNNHCATLAEALSAGGYQTFMTGKWHVGTYRPNWPVDRGFDRYFGIIRGAANYFHPTPSNMLMMDDVPFEPPPDFYTTDYFSKYAGTFIEEADPGRPFFLYAAYNAPHWPLQAWPEDISTYEGHYLDGWDALRHRRFSRQQEIGLFDAEVQLSPRGEASFPWEEAQDKAEWDRRMAVYAAMVDRMDQGIGRILEALRKTGREENTLIMFLSDNGGCAEHYNPRPNILPGPPNSATAYYLPWANASNTPFRLYKHWTHEGGIATPFIVHWPDVIEQRGAIAHRMGHPMDLMATCLEAAGVAYPETYHHYEITPLEGKSLLPIFRNPEHTVHQRLFWEHEGNRAVREGPWKLVSFYNEARTKGGVGRGRRTGKWQLYNLEEDRTELNNLVDRMPEKAARLETAYHQWARRAGVTDWEIIQRKLGHT